MYIKMKALRKWSIGFLFLAYTFVAHPSKAIGLATGPSLGMADFHAKFYPKELSKSISIGNLSFQVGWFAKLDIALLYARLDGLFVLDWRKLPDKIDRTFFRNIALPVTIGVPFFGLLRPHIGLLFLIPLNSINGNLFQSNTLIDIEYYSQKINGYILGLGIDLGNVSMDISSEFARKTISRTSIHPDLVDDHKGYRPRKLSIRIGYNLLR